jgi:hypothetical protein
VIWESRRISRTSTCIPAAELSAYAPNITIHGVIINAV